MNGYTRAELVGSSLDMLNTTAHTAQQLAAHLENIRRAGVVKLDILHRRKDGSLFPVEVVTSLINVAGRDLVLGIDRDISERKRAELVLRRQTMLLQLLQSVAIAANQATALEEVLLVTIEQICDCVDWPVGHVYLAPIDGHCPLVSTNIWHMREPKRFAVFRRITEAVAEIALGDLPGRVLLSGQPEWIADLTHAPSTARTKLISDIGVRAGFAFPILVGAEVAAVLEFFATEPHEPDAELLDVMVHIGTQLAHLIERTRVVAALRTAEAKYRILVEQLPAIIYIADSDSRSSTRYISPQIETILGFTPAEWLADPDLWLKQIHPDDRVRVLAELAQAYTNAEPISSEYRSRHRDGRIVWLRDESQIVRDEDGRPLFLQGITIDITEYHNAEAALRRSELLYRTLAQNFPSGAVFLFDHDLRYTIADGKGLAEQGYSRETLEGRTLYETLSPERISTQEPLYRAALAGHENVHEATSGEHTFMAYYLPVRNEQGEIFAGMVVSHDITALKQAEQALVAERVLLSRRVAERTADLSTANAELARAARLKDEFLASMSHELRTPLNAVLGLTESLREQTYGPINDRQERPLQMIEESSLHLLSLINDILDLAKIGAGQMNLNLEQIAVESICQASLGMIRQAALKKRIDIQTLLDPTATHVLADARRLIQILVNLLTNAVKFTPAGGTIGLEVQSDAEQQTLQFTVWDTGIGIPVDQLARLFQPFVQLDSRLARQYEGTGLGLALVARMTEMHGGSVAVSSAVGVGSRFSIVLPWNVAHAEPAQLAPTATPAVIRNALIIEDSPTAANQIARYLSELGITTETLTVGTDAVTQARASQPDVILLDILLPDTSGWQVLAQLKADPATQAIPVVIISVVDEQPHGRALGAARYLVKPCTRHDLQNALKHLSGEPAPAEQSSEQLASQPAILLAEDNEASILIVTDYLAMLGYQVVVVRNGIEALACAHELRPALILMDIQMPEMDGLETTRRLRADPGLATVPIIAITALAMPGDHELCLAAGANAYMSKPISLKNLAALIAEHLQRAQPADREPIIQP
jgi:PAS domain S-box-containing protein